MYSSNIQHKYPIFLKEPCIKNECPYSSPFQKPDKKIKTRLNIDVFLSVWNLACGSTVMMSAKFQVVVKNLGLAILTASWYIHIHILSPYHNNHSSHLVTFDLFDLVMKWKKIYITIWLSKLSILSHGYRVRSKLARESMKNPIQPHSVCLHTVSTEKRICDFVLMKCVPLSTLGN